MPEIKRPPSNVPAAVHIDRLFRQEGEVITQASPPAWPYQEQEQDIWQQAFDHEQISSAGPHLINKKSSSSSVE